MKIRNGFVSNSSTSSFCIIGTDDRFIIEQLANAEGKNFSDIDEWNFEYGCCEGKVVKFYGNEETPLYCGIPIEVFGENITIKEMKKQLVELIKTKLKINISVKDTKLIIEECGN